MRRILVCVLLCVAPAWMLLGTAGCQKKTKEFHETEQRHVSEPEMTSPGTEVVK